MASLVLALKIGVAVISKAFGRIVKSHLLIHRINLLQILLIQLKVSLQVRLYAGWSLGLWQNRSSVVDTPCQCDLCTCLSVLLSNLSEDWLLNELTQVLSFIVDLVRVSEWRVLGDMDALLRVPLEELLLLQPWVALQLVRSWDNLTLLQDPLGFRLAEVGNTDSLGLSALNQLLHRLVGIHKVDILGDHLSVGVLLKQLFGGLECSWPVHEVKVDVIEAEVLERGIESWLDGGWSVGVVPELGGDEELLARNVRLLDGAADCWLGAVDTGSVNVSVLWNISITAQLYARSS